MNQALLQDAADKSGGLVRICWCTPASGSPQEGALLARVKGFAAAVVQRAGGKKGVQVAESFLCTCDTTTGDGFLSALEMLQRADIVVGFLGEQPPTPVPQECLKAATREGHLWLSDIPGRSAVEYALRAACAPDAQRPVLAWITGSEQSWHAGLVRDLAQAENCVVEHVREALAGVDGLAKRLANLVGVLDTPPSSALLMPCFNAYIEACAALPAHPEVARLNHALHTAPIVYLHGIPGSGKSTCLAQWVAASRRAGATDGTDPCLILALSRALGSRMSLPLLCRVLADQLGAAGGTDATAAGMASAVNTFCRDRLPATVHLVVDGANELCGPGEAQLGAWLPRPLPTNLKILVACTPEHDALLQSTKHGSAVRMQGIKVPQRETVAQAVVRSAHAPWDAEVGRVALQGIKVKRFGGFFFAQRVFPVKHPLFLSVLMREACALPATGRAAAVERLASSGSVIELVATVVIRAANASDRAALLLKLLATSRHGVLELELPTLLGAQTYSRELSAALGAVAPLVTECAGRLVLRHPIVGECVTRALLPNEAAGLGIRRLFWQTILAQDSDTGLSAARLKEEVPERLLAVTSLAGVDPSSDDYFVLLTRPALAQTTIRLSKIGVTEGNLALLERFLLLDKTLQSLSLDACQLPEGGLHLILNAVSRHPELRSLSVSEMSLGTDSATAVKTLLQQTTALSRLTLRANGITEAEVGLVAEGLQANQTLESFELTESNFTVGGVRALCDCLRTNQSISELSLSKTKVGTSGIPIVSRLLEKNRSWRKLDLSRNQLGSAGIATLAKSLEVNSALRELSISANQFEDAGARALARALDANRTLLKLDMHTNLVGDQGAIALGSVLEKNTTLRELDVSRNQIRAAGGSALRSGAEANSGLKFLNIGHNHLEGSMSLDGNILSVWKDSSSEA